MTANLAYSTQSILASTGVVPVRQPTILLVDDDRTMRMVLKHALGGRGYEIRSVRDGTEAMELLGKEAHAIDAVVLDRQMPGMNGLEVIARMKTHPSMSGIPVIMLTGSGQQDEIQQGIEAGVFYYLVKPIEHALLCSVIDSALRERRQRQALTSELSRHSTALKRLQTCHLQLRTPAEAEDIACFLAPCFPNPERVVTGLLELLINAVEHGNLDVSYTEKTQLLGEGRWHEELERRLSLPEHAGKWVDVMYQHREEGWLVQITDKGRGFDWKRFWHIDPARANAQHGRGIARARLLAFDRLTYNESGNQVTAMVSSNPEQTIEW